MSYRRDFTIGLRETRGFYLMLVLEKWKKGILGFGLAGALAAYMYTAAISLSLPMRLLVAVGGAGAGMLAAALVLIVSTSVRVKGEVRRSGRDGYVQETEIDGFGVRVCVGKNRARMGFDKLVRVRETGRAFYLFISDNQAWILPKAQMEDRAEECRRIREILGAVIESGRLRLRRG